MPDVRPTILFVGESPPAGAPPDFRPFDCASGTRLAKALGLVDRAALLDHVRFTNVFPTPTGVTGCPPWDPDAAQAHGREILRAAAPRLDDEPSAVVALGMRAQRALEAPGLRPCTWARVETRHLPRMPPTSHVDVFAAPHPSGQSQALNTEEGRQEVRRALLPDICAAADVTLRPWHFRLDEPAVLADLGLALCPDDPPLGAVAAVVCAEVYRARVAPAGVDLQAYRRRVDMPLPDLTFALRDSERLRETLRPDGISSRSMAAEIRARHKHAARTLPRPPSAEVRAAYARLVALGVLP